MTALATISFFYVRYRGQDLRHPHLLGTLLVLVVSLLDGMAAAHSGGFISPYAFGLAPALMAWPLLMPGGARYAALPLGGGLVVFLFAVRFFGGPSLFPARDLAINLFQFVGVVMGVICADAVDRWRMRSVTAATTDGLTGAMTRRYFVERFEQYLASRRRHLAPMAVAMFDLDRFKDVNDNFGHSAGDEVLKAVCAAARASIRQNDLCGRIGGDEFVLVLDECTPDQAVIVMDRLRGRIAATPLIVRGARIQVTISAGVAAAKDGSAFEVAPLLRAADAALYVSKNGGRNRTSVSDASSN